MSEHPFWEQRTRELLKEKDQLESTCQRLRELAGELAEQLKDIAEKADHQIPFYAYGDHEAACDMAARLETILHITRQLEQRLKAEGVLK